MSLASALGGLLGGRDHYITGNYGWHGIPETVTIGDVPREELLKMVNEQIHQLPGYPENCKVLDEFFSQLTISDQKREITLQIVGAPDDGWYWVWCGEDTNRVAQARGLEYCTPEIVCKIFLYFREKMRTLDKEGFVHVSCGKLICTLRSSGSYVYSSEKKGFVPINIRQYVNVGNERFKASPGERVIYVKPRPKG